MSNTRNYIAFDLGAESGRTIAATFTGEQVTLHVINRFSTSPVRIIDALHWDILGLFREMKAGLQAYGATFGREIASIGVDTWGVDFGLLDRHGSLLANPLCYRDPRFQGQPEKVFRHIPRRELYEKTGIQILQINTLFQLYALVEAENACLQEAASLLMMPDLLNYFFTGEKVQEFTNATTTQMYNPTTSEWANDLLQRLKIPTEILPDIIAPGSIVGTLFESIAAECDVDETPVVAPASHDTGSAVAAVPATGNDWLFLSSGTWSLLGAELTHPIINNRSLELNFTNEGGVDGTFRLLKNITGLWLVQECRRALLKQGQEFDYVELTRLASEAKPFQALIDPDHKPFMYPGDMIQKLTDFCAASGQTTPDTPGGLVRMILESLALTYRTTARDIESITETTYGTIHIIGGGAQNELLNQFTADATGKEVKAGPFEATAFGNVLMQAIALGDIGSLAEGREVVRNSVEIKTFPPASDRSAWDAAEQRFNALRG